MYIIEKKGYKFVLVRNMFFLCFILRNIILVGVYFYKLFKICFFNKFKFFFFMLLLLLMI